ncbi:WD-repeat protein [Reticulomyxa filosa]|uniref:WD-repeat protein n=1 Tax=Reticulomyxa filosa TaxID=46433 RepID=X6M7H2_RETFI|nr:WD-repeat protein [Reticulomyxa filosa]|eukprot:ETO08985.1 WD-repeat protein [Reticulomyxa filosa]
MEQLVIFGTFFFKKIFVQKKKITFDMKEWRKGDALQFRLQCIKNKWQRTNITFKQQASMQANNQIINSFFLDIPINNNIREDVKNFLLMRKWLQNPAEHLEKNNSARNKYNSKDNNETTEVYKRRILFQILKLIILQYIINKCGMSEDIVKELEQANSEECKKALSSEMKALHDLVTRYHKQTEESDVIELVNDCEQLCAQIYEISNQEDTCMSLVEPNDDSPTRKFRMYFFNSDNTKQESSMTIAIRFGRQTLLNNLKIFIDLTHSQTMIIYKFQKFTLKPTTKFNGAHTHDVYGIEFSSFNGGRYLCSGSRDKTIRLWDVETSKSLHVFNGHENNVCCVDISPLQSNNNNERNSIGVIGGNGYTICSGPHDNTIRIWDIETAKQLNILRENTDIVRSVKYGSNELDSIGGANTILSGSDDTSICLWDIRSSKQIQVFKGHDDQVSVVEYSPFVVNNIETSGSSNVICSGSYDNTIRFWDIRSNKNELHVIKENNKEVNGIISLKFIQLKKSKKCNGNLNCGIYLCYGLIEGQIRIWG